MPIQFTCPHCGLKTNVADQYVGQTGPCAGCQKTVTITTACRRVRLRRAEAEFQELRHRVHSRGAWGPGGARLRRPARGDNDSGGKLVASGRPACHVHQQPQADQHGHAQLRIGKRLLPALLRGRRRRPANAQLEGVDIAVPRRAVALRHLRLRRAMGQSGERQRGHLDAIGVPLPGGRRPPERTIPAT